MEHRRTEGGARRAGRGGRGGGGLEALYLNIDALMAAHLEFNNLLFAEEERVDYEGLEMRGEREFVVTSSSKTRPRGIFVRWSIFQTNCPEWFNIHPPVNTDNISVHEHVGVVGGKRIY